MHTLVQFCTQSWLSSFHNDVWWRQLLPAAKHPPWDQNKWKGKFLKVISALYPFPEYETWGGCQRLDAHVDMVLEEEPDDVRDVRNWLRLLGNAADFRANRRGKYEEAERMLRRGLETAGKGFSKDLDVMCPLREHLIDVLDDQGKYQEAEQRCQQLLRASKRANGNENNRTLETMGMLAWVSTRQGKYDEVSTWVDNLSRPV